MKFVKLLTVLAALLAFGIAFGVVPRILPRITPLIVPGQEAGGSISAKDLAKYQSAYESSKKAYSHHPSQKAKQGLISATDRYAFASMNCDSLDRKIKYKQALRLYNETLKMDPKNHEAKNNSDLIISIYHSLHRPVPH